MAPASVQSESAGNGQWFATTHWSLVLNAADSVSPESDSALDKLCRSYWYPLYAYVRRRGFDADTAKDLTQEFFAQLLSKRLLTTVDPAKGRFRSWLLGIMKHFLAHEWTKTQAQKRGGGKVAVSLDQLEAENRYQSEWGDEMNPEIVFDRRWAFTVLDHAAMRLASEYEKSGKANVYRALRDYVSVDEMGVTYEQAATELRLSVSAVKSAIHRLRQRYQELIRAEITETVSTPGEVDEEIRYLLAVIQS